MEASFVVSYRARQAGNGCVMGLLVKGCNPCGENYDADDGASDVLTSAKATTHTMNMAW